MERTLPHLPSEMIFNILTRLPVKSLMRFRCVCKSWYCLVSDSNFIHTHLNQTCENNNGGVFAEYRSVGSGEDIFSLHSGETFVEHIELEYPLPGRFNVVGCSHGVLCLSRLSGPVDIDIDGGDYDLFLWNPAIQKFKALNNSLQPGNDFMHLAFGFVPRTNDYKVLKFFHSRDGGGVAGFTLFEIYSLRMNSWRRFQTFIPGHVCSTSMDTVLNGFVHFWAYGFIFTFDMADEVFSEMKTPECCYDDSVDHSFVTVLKGSLYLFVNCVDGEKTRSDVWVMKEYGVAESWTKQFTFGEWLRPFCRGAKATGVLLYGKDWKPISYDPRVQQVKEVRHHGDPRLVRAVTYYTESLVLLDERN